jgi:hypothetical protein
VLTPLLPLLIEVAQFRKQAVERLYKTFCRYRDQAHAGTIQLPYRFKYTDRSFSVTEDAPTIAAVSLMERPVTLTLTLWNRDTWVEAHPELYGRGTQWMRKRQLFAYTAEKELHFLQYEGPCEDLLWCGDVLATWPVYPNWNGFYLLLYRDVDEGWKLLRIRRDTSYAQFVPLFAARNKAVEEINRLRGKE